MLSINFFEPKIQTVGSVKDFLAERPVRLAGEAMTVGALAGMTIATLTKSDTVLASSIADTMIKAFDPLIEVVQGLGYPVGFIMICAGALVMMTGNKQKGLNMIKWAAIGFILLQFAPALMKILVQVGRAMMPT